jgi:hypothetical protein
MTNREMLTMALSLLSDALPLIEQDAELAQRNKTRAGMERRVATGELLANTKYVLAQSKLAVAIGQHEPAP